jgi:uncharacterized membrane protein
MRKPAQVFRSRRIAMGNPGSRSVIVGLLAAALSLPLGACSNPTARDDLPGDESDSTPFAAIGPEETVRFAGNEPFWSGEVSGTTLTYKTPESAEGAGIIVSRFAGRGGLSWNGQYEGQRFTLAVTPGECSDTMSDRTYPFVATLQVAGEQRNGCAWTDRSPFVGPSAP